MVASVANCILSSYYFIAVCMKCELQLIVFLFHIVIHIMSYCRDLTHTGKDLKGCIFLEALAQREEANRCGKMTVS